MTITLAAMLRLLGAYFIVPLLTLVNLWVPTTAVNREIISKADGIVKSSIAEMNTLAFQVRIVLHLGSSREPR